MQPHSEPTPAAETAATPGTEAAETAKTELEQDRARLEAERRQFLDEQSAREADWQRRCDAAWQRLRHETAKVAGEKQLALRLRRHANTEIDISRQQLEACWSHFRREQDEWAARRAQEEAGLRDRSQTLDAERQQLQERQESLQKEREDEEKARSARINEALGLENRIRNYCAKLSELRQEVACLEGALDSPSQTELLPVTSTAVTSIHPVSLPKGPEGVLAFLTVTAHDLVDQSHHLLDMHRQLHALRDSWRMEWDRALAALSEAEDDQRRRDRSLTAHEEELERREMKIRLLGADLSKRQLHCQCWEARLIRRQSALQAERSRMATSVKVQVAAAAEQRRILLRLQQLWEERRGTELEAYRELCASREAARQDYLRHREALRQRLLNLNEKECELEERDFVLTVARHQLIANDPNPVAAQKELQRRLDRLQRIVRRPLRDLEKYEREIEKRAEQLERFRRQLVESQNEIVAQEADFEERRITLDNDQLNMSSERIQWQAELLVLNQDRSRLLQHKQELEQQLEQLTLLLTESQESALRIAA